MAKREPVMPPIGGKVMHVGNGSAVWVFNTLADLKAKKVASVKQDDQAIIIGYDSEGDGRSMQFRYDASSSQTADDINYVDPDEGDGQWVRAWVNLPSIESGDAGKILRAKSDESGWESITASGAGIATETYVDDKASLSGLVETGFNKNIPANEYSLKNTRPACLNVLERPAFRPVWVDDTDIYSVSNGVLFKNGLKVGYPNATIPRNNIFYKAPNGNLLCMFPTWDFRLSTDDGETWTTVLDFEDGNEVLGVQSIALDEQTGYLYLVDYVTNHSLTGGLNTIYRSTDNGANWTVWKTTSNSLFRHWHGCQYDPVGQTIYFLGGDDQDDAGIYRLNSAKDDIEAVYLNKNNPEFDKPARSIGVCFFQNHIVWASDSFDPAIYRIARADIGSAGIEAEKICEIANTGWWTQRAKDDDSAWIACTASQVINRENDNAAHLYYIENEGLDVWNVGAEYTDSNYERFGPVGSERKSGGDEFWISGTINLKFHGKCSVTKTPADLLSKKEEQPDNGRRPISVSQSYDWKDGDTSPRRIFRYRIGSRPVGRLQVHEAGCGDIGGGFMTISIKNDTKGTTLFSCVNQDNYRQANEIPAGVLYESSEWDPGDYISIELIPNSATAGYGFMVVSLP